MNILYVSEIKNGYPFVVTVELNSLQYQIVVDVPAMVFLNKCRLHVVNIDQWLLKETAMQFSYVEFVEMAKAYRKGYDNALLNTKSREVFRAMASNIIHKIFNTKILSAFKSAYRVELLDYTTFINVINNLRSSGSIDRTTLQHLINKLYKYAEINSPDNLTAIENIAKRFNIEIDTESDDGLSEIINNMINSELDKVELDKYHHDSYDLLNSIYG